MRTRVLIAQPYVPRYRTAFFRSLSELLAEAGLSLEILVSDVASASMDQSKEIPVRQVKGRLARLTQGRVEYRKELLRQARSGDVAMVIVEQAAKNVDFMQLVQARAAHGYRVGVWGHGDTYFSRNPGLAGWVRVQQARMADHFFAYTEGGAAFLQARGVSRDKMSVLRNTIDVDELRRDLDSVTEADMDTFNERLCLSNGRTVLFMGRLSHEKDVRFLLGSAPEATRRLQDFTLLIAGAGPMRREVERTIADGGLSVRLLGRLDGKQKALALKASSAIVMPSWIGLVAIDSLVSGRPIVTRSDHNHAPEAEYLTRETALWLPSGIGATEYGGAVADLLLDPTLIEMQEACLRASQDYALSHMVTEFANGILKCLR